MQEKEKMLSQKLYDANNDIELLKERDKAKEMCFEFNNLRPSDTKRSDEIIKKLFGKVKGKFTIMPQFWCDYGYNIEIGDNFFANHNMIILDSAKVVFGDNCFIAPNCSFYTSGHPIDYKRRNMGLEYAYPIIIGDNCWIGANSIIMPGVKIGNNAVIGAGSVVVKDIHESIVAYGNPCKAIRKITKEDEEKNWDRQLLEI